MLNAADLAMLVAVLGCPAAAGFIAFTGKAGANTLSYIAGGFAFGATVALLVHKLAYGLLKPSSQQSSEQSKTSPGWTMVLAHTFLPLTMALSSIVVAAWLAHQILRHLK